VVFGWKVHSFTSFIAKLSLFAYAIAFFFSLYANSSSEVDLARVFETLLILGLNVFWE
jgi:hypothetical protein